MTLGDLIVNARCAAIAAGYHHASASLVAAWLVRLVLSGRGAQA